MANVAPIRSSSETKPVAGVQVEKRLSERAFDHPDQRKGQANSRRYLSLLEWNDEFLPRLFDEFGIAVVDADNEANIIAVNRHAEQLLGVSLYRKGKHPLRDYVPPYIRPRHDEHYFAWGESREIMRPLKNSKAVMLEPPDREKVEAKVVLFRKPDPAIFASAMILEEVRYRALADPGEFATRTKAAALFFDEISRSVARHPLAGGSILATIAVVILSSVLLAGMGIFAYIYEGGGPDSETRYRVYEQPREIQFPAGPDTGPFSVPGDRPATPQSQSQSHAGDP